MLQEIKHASFYDTLIFDEPALLSEPLLHAVHSEAMIQQIKELSTQGDAWIDLDTYVCQSDYETARLAAGGLMQLAQMVLSGKADNGFALVRPPGHHATSHRSMGFCLFNNAAITAHTLAQQGKKILIFDPDVHHGNGTQDIFYHRNDVLYQSLHLSPHYPGTGSIDEIGTATGEGYTVNAPLTHGNGDNAVSQLLDEIYIPIAQQFNPDIIIMSIGYDSHHNDQLGGLNLTANIYGDIITRFQTVQPKIVCTLEGGYNLTWIGKCLVAQLGAMVSQPVQIDDTAQEISAVSDVIQNLKNELGGYWKL